MAEISTPKDSFRRVDQFLVTKPQLSLHSRALAYLPSKQEELGAMNTVIVGLETGLRVAECLLGG